ncbi:hypothetical protein DFH09DRAFT_1105336 [Mycena vulgaris]|nr:hypothetical protein DFH09DRAFT_1105336 [Mycena vulgaris]
MPRIYIKAPSSDTERMLRELMGPPDMSHFNLEPCATEYDHVLDMSVGEEPVGMQRVATWRAKCEAPARDGPCATQYAPKLHPRDAKQLQELLADFTPRSDATNKFLTCVAGADDAFAVLYQLPKIKLPPLAANRLANKLSRARKYLEDMPTAFLPTATQRKEMTGPTNHIDGDISSDEEDPDADEDDPEWESLPIVKPKFGEYGNDGNDGRLIRVVVYTENDKVPVHARIFLPHGMNLDLSTYPYPILAEWFHTPLFAFSVFTKRYEQIHEPLNMEGRGTVMIYRRFRVHKHSCPRSAQWERWAVQSSENDTEEPSEDEEEDKLPPSSDPAPASSLQTPSTILAPVALVLVASSSKVQGKRRAESPESPARTKRTKPNAAPGEPGNPIFIDD